MAIHKLTNDIIPTDWYAETRSGDAVGEVRGPWIIFRCYVIGFSLKEVVNIYECDNATQ